jgi:hypothetical protein
VAALLYAIGSRGQPAKWMRAFSLLDLAPVSYLLMVNHNKHDVAVLDPDLGEHRG